MRALAFRLETRSPSDVSGLRELFARGALQPSEVVAILGKTEGNGGRNDFTRELATTSFARAIAERSGEAEAAVHERVVLSMSGGTEGVATPHVVVLGRREDGSPRAGEKRLAVGVGHTRAFAPEEIGRLPQIEETARVLGEITRALGVASAADVHLVQMKGAIPGASFEAHEAAKKAGKPLRNDMVHSRAASALGVALGAGEVARSELDDDAVCARWDLFSSVASVSAKPGLVRSELLVLANSPAWSGELAIAHGVMRDLLDTQAIRGVLAGLGLASPGALTPDQRERVVGVFAKAEADPRGVVRGKRHVMLDDDDVSDTRWARCTLNAVLASTLGETAVYVSTRAEHHGPLGGGPVAILAKVL